MQLRLAQLSDIPALADLLTQVWQSAYQAVFPADILAKLENQKWYAGLEKNLVSPSLSFYIAEEGEKLVGMIVFGQGREKEFGESEIYLLNVLPDYQRQGIGQALMNKAFELCGEKSLYLQVISQNQQARSFYEKLGFRHTHIETEREMWGVPFTQAVYRR